MGEGGHHHELGRSELAVLAAGMALALVPGLPFLQSDAAAFGRFRNWAIFVGGLLIGAVLSRARARLPR